MPRILISGASVAGPALASWMAELGWDVTVVERADGLREEGQNIDVRGAAREVLRRMGLEDAVRAAGTGEEGTEFVDGDGEVLAAFGLDDSDGDGPTAELEILRGQLARVLHDAAPDAVTWVFGDHVEAIQQREAAAAVRFASGRQADYDVVAIAEGQPSATRALVFDDVEQHRIGACFAYVTIPRRDDDTRTWRWYNAPGARQVHLRPDDVGTTRAMLGFASDDEALGTLERAEQITLLRDVFADVGWAAPRILDALDDAPFYFDDLTQVVAPRWSAGRVVLLGDAAHCVTPLGGGGTSLALIDAFVLQRALAGSADVASAFGAYERFMRPHAEQAQHLPPGTPRLAFPRSRLGVAALRTGLRLAGSDLVQPHLPEPASGLDEIDLDAAP